jgi:hypothetical protein
VEKKAIKRNFFIRVFVANYFAKQNFKAKLFLSVLALWQNFFCGAKKTYPLKVKKLVKNK